MRIVAIKQCDAWEPVSRTEMSIAGKRALFAGISYELADGTLFSAVREMTKDRRHRVGGEPVSLERATKEGLVKRAEKTSA